MRGWRFATCHRARHGIGTCAATRTNQDRLAGAAHRPALRTGHRSGDGFKLFWEQVDNTAGGRKVEYVIADTTCNPDQAITQARRLVHQEKVHIMIGPLCGHEGPAVAQVSKETGIPLVMDIAGADDVTKWNRTPTVVRTASVRQPDRPSVRRLSLQGARRAQCHVHRPRTIPGATK